MSLVAQGRNEAGDLPEVIVLMATFNGRRWVDDQVDSILAQEGVRVSLVVSDDGSNDGTLERLAERAGEDSRIRVLPRRVGSPGVAANFLHLFTVCSVTNRCYVAFSDQDDLWRRDKLRRQVDLLCATGADVVSSNVVSFDSSGRRRLIVKDKPQRQWDHVFEAAGPGSTYLFTPQAHRRLVQVLCDLDTAQVSVHDWFIYALARALGETWVIDGDPLVEYRQHSDNVQGAHSGVAAFRSRLRNLRSGFYRGQFILTARTVLRVGAPVHGEQWRRELNSLISDLEDTGLRGRWGIARRYRQIRRDQREGFELALSGLVGVW